MPIQTVSQAASNQKIPFGNRNVIINGDMRFWQRATSKTGVSDNTYETVDRFKPRLSYTGGSTNITRTETSLPGFPYALRYDHTGSTGTVSGAWYAVRHVVEKGNCHAIARAGAATLSFWYKSNRTGNHYASADFLFGGGFTGSHLNSNGFAFNVAVADTWQKYEYTFLFSLTNNTAVADNGIGFGLSIGINTEVVGVPTVSTSHYFEVTGIQLEAGTQATEFENRSYETELASCQRYFQTYSMPLQTSRSHGFDNDNYRDMKMQLLPVVMRATPTFTRTSARTFGDAGNENPNGATVLVSGDASKIFARLQYTSQPSGGTVHNFDYVATVAAEL